MKFAQAGWAQTKHARPAFQLTRRAVCTDLKALNSLNLVLIKPMT